MLESDHESAPRRTRSADAGVCATTSSNSEGRAQRLGMSALMTMPGIGPVSALTFAPPWTISGNSCIPNPWALISG